MARNIIQIHDWWLSPGKNHAYLEPPAGDIRYRIVPKKTKYGEVSTRQIAREESKGRSQNICYSLVLSSITQLWEAAHLQYSQEVSNRTTPTDSQSVFSLSSWQ